MLTYVIVLVVVAAVLYGSFRALGGGAEPVGEEDYRAMLERLVDAAHARARELDEALRTPDGTPPLTERAAAMRKSLSAYQQQLGRVEAEIGEDLRELIDNARSLLSAAIEDLGWACRMVEIGTFGDNPGVQRAVEALREHGGQCLETAARLVRGAPAQ